MGNGMGVWGGRSVAEFEVVWVLPMLAAGPVCCSIVVVSGGGNLVYPMGEGGGQIVPIWKTSVPWHEGLPPLS